MKRGLSADSIFDKLARGLDNEDLRVENAA